MHTCTPYCDGETHCQMTWFLPLGQIQRASDGGPVDAYDPVIARWPRRKR